ncbi:MAG: tyrosine-type recombinase/integrase [Deinococcus sp.]|nr:tyrosine-type recombinase/integrase [Deinococcus sp.]
MNDLQHHIQDFLAYGRQRGHSPNTLAAYRSALGKFAEYAAEQGVTTVGGVTRQLLRAYAAEVGGTLNPGGAHARLRPLKTFFTWLEDDEVLDRSPMRRVSLPKLPKYILPAVTREDMGLLLSAARESNHPLRDRAILVLLYDTGVRASELCGIRLEDLQPGGRLDISRAKGSRSRMVPISRTALRHINRYLKQERPKAQETALFLSRTGEPMNRNTVKQLIERLCRAAGTKRYSPHAFRRGFAVNYLRNSGDVFTLQRILGHTTLEMTNHYVVMQVEDLKEAHRRASPVDRLRLGTED